MSISVASIKSEAEKLSDELVSIRRHIHQNPELSFEEEETASFISDKLMALDIPHEKDVGGNGVIGMIGNGDGATIALRADIDALPIQEANDVDYKSKNDGIMHACGHDVHTTCLIGAATILKKHEDELPGKIKLIFQPAEEKLPGGASILIKAGVLENPKVDAIYGQHVHPPLQVGKVAMRPGIMMASADEIYLTIKGRGGHAALPQDIIDPILIASHIVVALQQVVSRMCHPSTPCVLSFGKIIGEGATNVIPNAVKIEGTFRTFDEEWRERALIGHRKNRHEYGSIHGWKLYREYSPRLSLPSKSRKNDLAKYQMGEGILG